MIELGKKNEIFGVELLRKFNPDHDMKGRPTCLPRLDTAKKEAVICGYDQGLGERMIVCENLDEMQHLYDAYARGSAIRISWYIGPDPGFVTAVKVVSPE
jgi:hypothetical protein